MTQQGTLCRKTASAVPGAGGVAPWGTDRRVRYLGNDEHGYDYTEGSDRYVYQWRQDGSCTGWVCSLATWERTLHRIVVTP
jgi:hypothetical protein